MTLAIAILWMAMAIACFMNPNQRGSLAMFSFLILVNIWLAATVILIRIPS
jgi:hypothetical protein